MDLSSVFLIQISDDKMQALIEFNREVLQHRSTQELHELKEQIHLKDLFDFARSKNVTYGLLEDVLLTMIKNFRINQDPVVFARGLAPQHGKNGMLKYHVQLGTTIEINDQEHIDFKEIMVIPKVETGTKLVTIIPPTESKDGMNVTGNVVKAKPGKPAVMKAGKNTEFQEEHQAIFATGSGQVSLISKQIQVLPVYEVKKSVSMETGNIDFNGSIVINGDVPTGFSLKARGDITIQGTVEAATLEAGVRFLSMRVYMRLVMEDLMPEWIFAYGILIKQILKQVEISLLKILVYIVTSMLKICSIATEDILLEDIYLSVRKLKEMISAIV